MIIFADKVLHKFIRGVMNLFTSSVIDGSSFTTGKEQRININYQLVYMRATYMRSNCQRPDL
jgi:hypothetical protein